MTHGPSTPCPDCGNRACLGRTEWLTAHVRRVRLTCSDCDRERMVYDISRRGGKTMVMSDEGRA